MGDGTNSHAVISDMTGEDKAANASGHFTRTAALYVVSDLTSPCSIAAENGIFAAVIGSPQRLDFQSFAAVSDCSSADTLIKEYLAYGKRVFERLTGSFSAAIVDTNRNSAILAVDRMGTHPLCYSLTPDGLIFGSDTAHVFRHPLVKSEIDPQAIFDYTYFHYVPSPKTIFKGLRKLEPAQHLQFEKNKSTLEIYWTPVFSEQNVPIHDFKEQLQTLLDQSVRRCHPNSKTGAFLSGGLDSSTVTGILANVQNPVDAYSIGFAQEGYDEMAYARIAAHHFGAKLHEHYVTPDDVVNAVPEIARAYDEPFGNSSALPALFCARMAKENGTDILLAGDGGDELFAGNSRYARQQTFDFYHRIPSWIRSAILESLVLDMPLSNWTPPTRKLRRYIEQARLPMPDRNESYNFLHRTNLFEMFEPDFLEQIDQTQPLHLLREVYDRTSGHSLLNRMLHLDWKFTLADNDLRKVNRMCELAGVQVRYPMLDDALVEFSTKIPSTLKLRGTKLRYFYKESLSRFLPPEIINKRKQGFGLPFGEWLKTSPELQELIYGSLSDLKKRHIIKPEFIDHLVETHRGGHAAYYGTMIWVLAMLEQWFQQHGNNY